MDDVKNISDRETLEIKYTLLMDSLNEKNDTQVRFYRWISSISFTLVLVSGGFLAYIFSGSIGTLRDDINRSVDGYLDKAVTEGSTQFQEIEVLRNQFLEATSNLSSLQDTIEGLRFLDRLPGEFSEIEPAIYARLKEIESEAKTDSDSVASTEFNLSQAQYLEVAVLLQRSLDAALGGKLEPNSIFNTAIIASRLGFEAQSAKLRTVSYHILPDPNHRAVLLASQDIFGVGYTVSDGELLADGRLPDQVRKDAWAALLILVGSVPMQAQTQSYSQAANVATRNRSLGYEEGLLEAFEAVVKDRPDLVTGYTHAMISDFYARLGGPDWRLQYEKNRDLAVRLIAAEPPSLPIYSPTIRRLLNDASDIGGDDVTLTIQILEAANIDWRKSL